MNDGKISSRALERGLSSASSHARNGMVVYRSVRNLMITFGISAAIILPLASDQSDQTPPPPASEIKVVPLVPVVVNTKIEPRERDDTKPNITVHVNTSPITGAPPISRDWHRTTFENDGDEFWALPDARFILEFTPGPGFADCRGDTCLGSWDMTTETRRPLMQIIAGANRSLTFAPANAAIRCSKRSPDDVVTDTLSCRLTTATPDEEICVWIRRSLHTHLEPDPASNRDRPERASLPLDIRWQPVDRSEDCLALMPE